MRANAFLLTHNARRRRDAFLDLTPDDDDDDDDIHDARARRVSRELMEFSVARAFAVALSPINKLEVSELWFWFWFIHGTVEMQPPATNDSADDDDNATDDNSNTPTMTATASEQRGHIQSRVFLCMGVFCMHGLGGTPLRSRCVCVSICVVPREGDTSTGRCTRSDSIETYPRSATTMYTYVHYK